MPLAHSDDRPPSENAALELARSLAAEQARRELVATTGCVVAREKAHEVFQIIEKIWGEIRRLENATEMTLREDGHGQEIESAAGRVELRIVDQGLEVNLLDVQVPTAPALLAAETFRIDVDDEGSWTWRRGGHGGQQFSSTELANLALLMLLRRIVNGDHRPGPRGVVASAPMSPGSPGSPWRYWTSSRKLE